MANPKYIRRGGEQVFQHPFTALDVQFFGFGVKADIKNLGVMCDKYLNAPLNLPGNRAQRFVPAISHVLFVFNRLGKLFASNGSPDHNRGWYKEQEGAIWTLVLDRERKNLFWFHPYMLVDSTYALSMGREIYGFPKQYGWFQIPDGPDAPDCMQVEAVVCKTLSAACEANKEVLFRAQRVPKAATNVPPHAVHANLPSLVSHVAETLGIGEDFLDHFNLGENLCKDLLRRNIPMVFLKQIRDGCVADEACFQSIQECMTKMTRFHDARVYFHKYQIVFDDYATHPIREDLGFPTGPLKADVAFWSKFDFEIGLCSEVV